MTCRLSLFVVFAAVFSSPIFAQWSVGPTGNGSNVPASGSVPSPVMDAMGDAIDFGAGPPLLDIDTLDVRFDADTLHFSMSFFDDIAQPSTGAANSLVGVIDLDVDQDILTGGSPAQNDFPPLPALGAGIDFRIDLFSETVHPGVVDVLDVNFAIVGSVPVNYTAASVFGSVPLTLLGDDDGVVDFAGIIGTIPQPTDAMDVLGFSVPVPEPGSLTLCLLVGVFLRCGPFRRRRATCAAGAHGNWSIGSK